MILKRSAILAVAALIAVPLLLPFVSALHSPEAWAVWGETERLLSLLRNTLLLAAGTLSLTLTLGVPLAVILFRTSTFGRRFLQFALLVNLFLPLPVVASAWQSAFGTATFEIWDRGLAPAILAHSFAALPWVVWIVGLGLCRVERDLEEAARVSMGARELFRKVTLPRAMPGIGLAALWVVVTVATEIAVTDVMMVRTFAEEVYTQFAIGTDGLNRSVIIGIPWTLMTVAMIVYAARVWPTTPMSDPPGILFPGDVRTFLVASVLVSVTMAVPLASLLWRAGGGHLASWEGPTFVEQIARVPVEYGPLLITSLLCALAVGVTASGIALGAAAVSARSSMARIVTLTLAALAWATPGPVVGFGLKAAIEVGMDVEALLTDRGPFRSAFYDGPSPLPVMWAALIRVFPFALAIVWPVARSLPRDAEDLGRLHRRGLRVLWHWSRRAFGFSVLASAVLALGEVSAGRLVQTPGGETYVQAIFDAMHYGVGPRLAAMCLWQVFVIATLTALLFRRS